MIPLDFPSTIPQTRAMTTSLRSIPCRDDAELLQLLEGDATSLAELARYNGTAAGATAIASTRNHAERVQRELDRRRVDYTPIVPKVAW